MLVLARSKENWLIDFKDIIILQPFIFFVVI